MDNILNKVKKINIKKIDFRKIVLSVKNYLEEKEYLLKDREFIFLLTMFVMSIFSIPDFDNLFITITRVIFVLMALSYIMLEVYRFSQNGIKFNHFVPEMSEGFSLADKCVFSIISVYFIVMFISINISMFALGWLFVYINKLSENRYN